MLNAKYIIALLLAGISLCRSGAQTKRLALVIGNDNYPGNALANARNDAKSVAKALELRGYIVTLKTDLNYQHFLDDISSFDNSIAPGSTVLFYYAGHGLQVSGENYLVPVDFKATSQSNLKYQGIALSEVLDGFVAHGAETQVIILDACRNNPFLGDRSAKGGWAGMGSSAGTFLAFGTAPGSTAADGLGADHGLFTQELLPYLATSELDIEQMFQQVRYDVIRASQGLQVPWVASSLIGSLHIDPQADDGTLATASSRPNSSDRRITGLLGRPVRGTSGSSSDSAHPRSASRGIEHSGAETGQLRELISSALTDAGSGDYDTALRTIKEALELAPASSSALRVGALLLHLLGRTAEARQYLDRAYSADPYDPRLAYYDCLLSSREHATTVCSGTATGFGSRTITP